MNLTSQCRQIIWLSVYAISCIIKKFNKHVLQVLHLNYIIWYFRCFKISKEFRWNVPYDGSMFYQSTNQNCSPLRRILSSNVALNAPSGVLRAFFTCPRSPLTVRILAPSNFVTSNMELNIPYEKNHAHV